jgi:hypothetical protein
MSASATRGTFRVLVRRMGGLDLAELVHLRRAHELAEAVADEDGPRHLLLKEVAAVRHDGRDAGAHVFAANQSRVADSHAFNVCDGVESSGRQHADDEADVARARSLLFAARLSHKGEKE